MPQVAAMSAPATDTARRLADLPPEWPEDLMPGIRRQIAAAGRKVVVLDDDPTGTQTVHGIPVLTGWSEEALAAELKRPEAAFYLLTNSRSMTAAEARALNREIGRRLRQAAEKVGAAVAVVSRSDSTLRGHFPAEVEALCAGLERPALPCLVIPFFLEGGRYTIDDIHYVDEGGRLVPASQTAYAQDAVFGYRNADLRCWVEEKTGGRIPAGQVAAIGLDAIRRGGPAPVAEKLAALGPGSVCVVNAASYRDLEVVVTGLLAVEGRGRGFVCRTAASFVRVRSGLALQGLLRGDELTTGSDRGGLFVVGSYVPQTTAQLAALRDQTPIGAVALEVADLLDPQRAEQAISRAGTAVNRLLDAGADVVLFTSRRLVTGAGDQDNLVIGRRVSDGLIAVVQALNGPPRYLVAKGGVTSSDVATRGLGVQRAMVLGQVLPGVPVWRLGPEACYPGMAYIVFPGNVGGTEALVTIYRLLARKNPAA
jgi:uncharacterized protein YgbK (DUF1537 family)